MKKEMFHRSNLITYLGIVFSTLGLFLAFHFNEGKYALICLAISGLCDLFDGVFARRFERSDLHKAMGVQLDSLADVLNFGALPLAAFYIYGMNSFIYIPFYIIYMLTIISRLAYYNVSVADKDNTVSITHFIGLPVTYASLIFPIAILILKLLSLLTGPILAGISLTISLFFVADVSIKKPKGKMYIFFGLLAIIMIPLIAIFG